MYDRRIHTVGYATGYQELGGEADETVVYAAALESCLRFT